MTYICLAAGKGTRFARLSSYMQKCMYPVGVHPFVEYSVASLVLSETVDRSDDTLVFVIGHHADQIRSYFGDSYAGLPVKYVEQREQLGTGHAIETARSALGISETVIPWLADLFVSSIMFDGIRRNHSSSALTIAESDHTMSNNVRVDTEDDRVVRAWKGSSDLFDIGLWKLAPEILESIASNREDEYRVLINVQHALEAGATVGFQQVDEWIHLGGVEPTVEENIRQVVHRLTPEASLFDRLDRIDAGDTIV